MSEIGQYQHWRIERDEDNIVSLILDRSDTSANALSRAVMQELNDIIETLEQQPPRGVIIQSGKANGFIAGADVKEFTTLKNSGEALQLIRFAQSVLDRLESLSFPTIALIHGFCLGGGLELALACRYRIADDDLKTKIGLPEVRLGIHPGFGGTVRLPKLIGSLAAMNIMLGGKALSARAAKKLGVIDEAVPHRQLQIAALTYVKKPPVRHYAQGLKALAQTGPVRALLAPMFKRQVRKHARPDHYPAPYALIDLWAKHGDDPTRMLKQEAESVARLVVGETGRNLIRVFFLQEQLKALGEKKLFAPKHVHVIGGGVMGGDIAAWCALQGMQVTVQDRKPETLAKVIRRAYELFQKNLKQPLLIQAALDRLMPDQAGQGVGRADVVIEAIFENIDAKQSLYRDIEPRMKPEALLATNTSSIPLEILNTVLVRPERLVGLHFFNPVAKMQLVEIVSAANTDPEVCKKAASFARHIDRLPLFVKSSPGFLVNRILMPYLLEAVIIEAEGIAPTIIDQAALDFGMPMGPIELADTVGLDICLSVAEMLSQKLDITVPDRLRELVRLGRFGKKSGLGFYSYVKGKKVGNSPSAVHSTLGDMDRDLQDRLIFRLLNESVACLREGVVDRSDLLDAGIIFGTGFAPFRGGPLHYVKERGIDVVKERLSFLEKRYGSRFIKDQGWEVL